MSRLRVRAASSNRCCSEASEHAALEVALDLVRAPLEERDHVVDDGAIGLARDQPDARGRAPADVVIEARDARAAPGRRPLAGPVREDLVERLERRAHLLRRGVRAEVAHAGAMALAREQHARVLVRERDRDVGIRLVVPQARVERRPVALDQLLLEQQRLARAGDDDRLDRGGPRDQLLALAVAVDAREVRGDALAQGGGLADVEHGALGGAPDVHAGASGRARACSRRSVVGASVATTAGYELTRPSGTRRVCHLARRIRRCE